MVERGLYVVNELDERKKKKEGKLYIYIIEKFELFSLTLLYLVYQITERTT